VPGEREERGLEVRLARLDARDRRAGALDRGDHRREPGARQDAQRRAIARDRGVRGGGGRGRLGVARQLEREALAGVGGDQLSASTSSM
jgi:hypothetical protein